MMQKSFFLFVLLSLTSLAKGQGQEQILRHSWNLSAIGYDMVECRKDQERDSCLQRFNQTLDSLMVLPGSFDHQFDSVKNIRILNSPDQSFRILTWGFRHPNDSFEFFGILQFADAKREAIWLSDSSKALKNENATLYKTLDPANWYGGLYYQIEKVRYKKETYYLLLGWNGHNAKTDQKILEILSFDENEEPVFGLPILDMDNQQGYQCRVIWEYKNGANMALQIESDELITFEHIEPADSRAKGIYTLYLPDGTYDFLEFKKGIWKKKTMLYDHMRNPER
ncbi:MAG: hypothetical protein LPK45_03845 [Bacteroidota bacterium]|nr:hypothetical protein [Bacteroidota bacterium]MDX5430183.1 hypothetical protein [Bacteroidota bacterium]MDX5468946.1 hypothetical protein [Bacteroidota bacterium]